MTDIFLHKKSNYSLRNSTALHGRSIKTAMYGSETISSSGPKIQDFLPTELKKVVPPTSFKTKILEWAPKNCACQLCKSYVQNI